MFKGHKEARIYNITLFVTHVLMFIMVQLLYIPFRFFCQLLRKMKPGLSSSADPSHLRFTDNLIRQTVS